MKRLQLLPLASLLVFSFASASATAQHGIPRPQDMSDVAEAAHELNEDARALHEAAEADPRLGTRPSVLRRLHALEERAAHFHKQVERYRQSPHHTVDDFVALLRSIDEAGPAFEDHHVRFFVRRQWVHTARSMERLRAYYAPAQAAPPVVVVVPAPAAVVAVWDRGTVTELAHDAEEALQDALSAAVAEDKKAHVKHSGKSIRQLIRSVRAAKHLHDQVERLLPDPRHTRGDLNELNGTFAKALRRLRKSPFSGDVQEKVRRAGNIIHAINDLYAIREVHGRRGWRW